jgi:hypothetical protein
MNIKPTAKNSTFFRSVNNSYSLEHGCCTAISAGFQSIKAARGLSLTNKRSLTQRFCNKIAVILGNQILDQITT